ncbi:STAS domain-containing protein [Actinoplanes sp. NPDC024001]|uniref:STAS domain-containing protein n=1 Tax=Actinoplanes sp. NPDC024001 TaxID=3154598 RepID=UPI0033EFA6A4
MIGGPDDAAGLHLSVRSGPDRVTITLAGELDRLTAPPLADLLSRTMDGRASHVEINMARVGFMDAGGLRVLLNAYRLGAERGVTVRLHRAQPPVVWMLRAMDAGMLLGDRGEARRATVSDRDRRADERDRRADDRDRRADERDQRADEREEQADDRERLAHERDRLLAERHRRVREHERWEDIREDLANIRDREHGDPDS